MADYCSLLFKDNDASQSRSSKVDYTLFLSKGDEYIIREIPHLKNSEKYKNNIFLILFSSGLHTEKCDFLSSNA